MPAPPRTPLRYTFATQGIALGLFAAHLSRESQRTRDHAPEQTEITEDVIKQAVTNPFPVAIRQREDSHEEEGHRNREEDRHRFEAEKGHRREKGNGDQEQARASREAKPVRLQKINACDKTKRHEEEKVDARGLLPKKEIERPAEQNDDGPEAVWVGFHGNLHDEFFQA